jgi:hypothetical protein
VLTASNYNRLVMQNLSYLFPLIFLFGCHQTSRKNTTAAITDTVNNIVATIDTYPKTKTYTKEEQEIRQKEFDEEEKSESIISAKVLIKAIHYAALNKNKGSFKFEMNSGDTSYSVTTQLVYGNLFTKNKKHLLVRRLGPSGVTSNIFL